MTRFAPGTSQATMDAVNQRMYGARPPVKPGMTPVRSDQLPGGPMVSFSQFQRSPQAPQQPAYASPSFSGMRVQPAVGMPDGSDPKPAYSSPSISPRPPMGGYGGMMGMGLGQMFGMGGGYGRPPMPPQYGGGFGGGFPGMMGYGRPPIPSQMNPFGFGGGFGGGYGRPPMPQYGGFGGYQPQPQQFGGYGGYGGMQNQQVQPQYRPQMQQGPFGSPMRMY